MSNKIKLVIFISIMSIVVILGIVISVNDFTKINDTTIKKETNTASETKEQKKNQEPILELTQDEVVLEVGSTFSFKDFIKKAEDKNGYNLKDKVNAPKAVPTDVPGEYQIEYTLELSNGKKISKQLLLKIVEFDLGTNSD